MRHKSKPFLYIAAILLGIPLLSTLGLNLYLQSPGVQDRLHSTLESLLGSPVSIHSTFGIPLGAIRLTGITTIDKDRSPLVSAETLSISPNYRSLLHEQLTIATVVLDRPVIQLHLESFPGRQPNNEVSRGSPPLSQDSNATSSPPSPGSLSVSSVHKIAPAIPEGNGSGLKVTGLIFPEGFKSLSIKNGEISAWSSGNLPVLSLSRFDLKARSQEGGGWAGNITAKQAMIGNSLLIHDLRSPASISADHFSVRLEKLSATLGAGQLTGSIKCDLPPANPAYQSTLLLNGASLKQLLADSCYGNSSAEGNLAGDLQISGIAGVPSTMEGRGNLTCTESVIQPVDFLKQIGRLLQIDELQLLRLQEAKCAFRIHQGGVFIDDLLMHSQNLMLNARGPISANGELDLESRLLLDEKLAGRLRGLLGSQLAPAPESGYSQITFHVSGNPANPKTDLLQRLTGLKIGIDLGGLLQGLFGHPASNH